MNGPALETPSPKAPHLNEGIFNLNRALCPHHATFVEPRGVCENTGFF
jgi:hypothetical protein